MPKAPVGPLTDKDYEETNRILQHCAGVMRAVETAQAANQPVDGHMQLMKDACVELTAIKKAFWPDRP
jgi:hypothetical protein